MISQRNGSVGSRVLFLIAAAEIIQFSPRPALATYARHSRFLQMLQYLQRRSERQLQFFLPAIYNLIFSRQYICQLLQRTVRKRIRSKRYHLFYILRAKRTESQITIGRQELATACQKLLRLVEPLNGRARHNQILPRREIQRLCIGCSKMNPLNWQSKSVR